MIPIRDINPSKTYPVVTYSLILVNVFVFIIEISQGSGITRFIYYYGLVPARYTISEYAAYFTPTQQIVSLVTFMFLHGGFWHLLGNMWSLYIFGDNIEDRLGPLRFFIFYVLCGLFSGFFHFIANYYSNVPTIGASGAIAGVMGAYFILFPHSRILTLIPIFFIPYFIEIPAFFFLGIWFLLQLVNASAKAGGIAWWAHIGGFIMGIVLLKLFDALPTTGLTQNLKQMTEKRKTHSFQVIRPEWQNDDPHLYGTIRITPYEAKQGVYKIINVPSGTQKRLFRVYIPSGMKDDQILRLKGLGKSISHNQKGDLMLKVVVQS